MTLLRTFGRQARPLLASVALAALLSACAVTPKPLSQGELAAQAEADRKLMFGNAEPLTSPLTLPEAIARVLKHNLDQRAKLMEEALAQGQLKVDRFDLLPQLTANAGYRYRSEYNAVRSRDLFTGRPSDANPTYSTDRNLFNADLGLTWNILDFGVSYYNAQQNADRVLIAAERRRRTVANLIQEVRFAYWRAAAAQTLKDKVTASITLAEQALADAEQVESEGLRDPVTSLQFQKMLLESLRQLEAIQHELAAAQAELAALINVAPGTELRLAVSDETALTVPGWSLTPRQMEELAFVNNPDLREQAYQSRIAADETRKAVLRMLPGISLDVGRKYDSNSFLYENQWNEVGARVSWNLFNLLSAPSRIKHAKALETVTEAKRLALRMAILAQVHVAHHQFQAASRQYARADQLWQVDSRLAEASARRQETSAQGMIERVAAETAAISAELRRYQTYAQLQAALGRMQASIGVDPLPATVASQDIPTLAKAVETHLERLSTGAVLPLVRDGQGTQETTGTPLAATEAGKTTVRINRDRFNLMAAS